MEACADLLWHTHRAGAPQGSRGRPCSCRWNRCTTAGLSTPVEADVLGLSEAARAINAIFCAVRADERRGLADRQRGAGLPPELPAVFQEGQQGGRVAAREPRQARRSRTPWRSAASLPTPMCLDV